METLLERFLKHSLRCQQCSKHPDNPCAVGGLILSAAASAAIISAQRSVHLPTDPKPLENYIQPDCDMPGDGYP